MNICISVDNNYIKNCIVMLDSLFACNSNSDIKLYVLYGERMLSSKNKAKIQMVVSKNRQEVSFVRINQHIFNNLPLVEYISVSTYFRLLLPFILDNSIEKVLYLDTDIIINGDIQELFYTNLDGIAFAGVNHKYMDRREVLDIKPEGRYLNAGVLLINLKWLRENSSIEKIFDYIEHNKEKLVLADQDIINGLFWKNNKCISNIYNYYPYLDMLYLENRKRQTIFHYYGRIKPWSSNYKGYGKEMYWKWVNHSVKEYSYFSKIYNYISGVIMNIWKNLKLI